MLGVGVVHFCYFEGLHDLIREFDFWHFQEC